MDIQSIISALVEKLTGKKDLIDRFTADPIGTVKDLLGIDIDKDQVIAVVKGVAAQLGDLSGEITKEGSGLLDKIRKMIGIG